MKDLILNDGTALTLPDANGIVEIDIKIDEHYATGYVPFEKLEKWVASIREQIITSSKGQATEEEIIEAGVNFMMDTSFGGE